MARKTGQAFIFMASSFYGHKEQEMGIGRAPRHKPSELRIYGKPKTSCWEFPRIMFCTWLIRKWHSSSAPDYTRLLAFDKFTGNVHLYSTTIPTSTQLNRPTLLRSRYLIWDQRRWGGLQAQRRQDFHRGIGCTDERSLYFLFSSVLLILPHRLPNAQIS